MKTFLNFITIPTILITLFACKKEVSEEIIAQLNGDWSVIQYFRNDADKSDAMDDSLIAMDTDNMILTTNILNMDGEVEEYKIAFVGEEIHEQGKEDSFLFHFFYENDQLVLHRPHHEYAGLNWDLKWILNRVVVEEVEVQDSIEVLSK